MRSVYPEATLVLTVLVISGSVCTRLNAAEIENIALNARYALWPKPNYKHCTDPNDKIQLTDGKLTSDYFWVQQGTVGWRLPKYASITVDLGEVMPIKGVSFRTAAGKAGVEWPIAIHIQVSDDGKSYFDLGNLIELTDDDEPLPDEYAVKQCITTQLKTHARHVRFLVIPGGPYVFVDEVEVFRGPESFLRTTQTGQPADNADAFVTLYRFKNGVQRRFRQDGHALGRTIRQAAISDEAKNRLLDRLAVARERLGQVDIEPHPGFRTILPLCDEHADLFRIQAALWKAQGQPPLTARMMPAWDPLDPFDPIGSRQATPIEVHTMQNEYRCAAFNLSNATDAPMRVSIRFEGLPKSPAPSYVTLYRVGWTDTRSGKVVASALLEEQRDKGGWSVEIIPGLLRQIWLTFHITDQPSDQHVGRIVMTAESVDKTVVPIRLKVYPLTFPDRTTLWLGGWSYTDGDGSRGVTLENRPQLLKHLQSRFVNAPWATPQTMLSFKLVQEDPPQIELDTRRFDHWLEQWPDARAYLVFLAVGKTFAKAQMGTKAFDRRVGAWISAWVSHLQTKRISPDRLALLLVDEPHATEQDDIIIAWARAIKAAEPEVVIWEDPVYYDPREGRAEMFELCDILCPNRPRWLSGGESTAEFYRQQQDGGRTLQLYSCSGPVRLLDPYTYYRLQAWHCWQVGATGSFFWAFGDNGKASSWNEYVAPGNNYTPVFLDATSVTAAKEMEAIRESVEDYEYFVMLSKAVQRAKRAGVNTDKATALLKSAADKVLNAPGTSELLWHEDKDRSKADTIRIQLLEALAELHTKICDER